MNSKEGSDPECLQQIKESGYLYLDFEGECHEAKDTLPCPFGQWLVADVFGDIKITIAFAFKGIKHAFWIIHKNLVNFAKLLTNTESF